MINEPIKDVSESTFVAEVIEKSREKIVIVDFWAPWCGPCKALTPILENQANKRKEDLEIVKVNIDENQSIASQLRIQSIPAVFAFSDGQPVDGFMGAKTEPEVAKFFDILINKFSKNKNNQSEIIKALISEERFEEAKLACEEMIKDQPSPENYSFLIKSIIGLGDYNKMEALIKNLSPKILEESVVKSALSSYELMKNNVTESSKDEILDRINTDPSDLESKKEISKILMQENNYSECIDTLLEIFEKDSEWDDGFAKKQLLLIFDHLGNENEVAKKGRRALTSLIFN